jgi:hypothetical protein
VNNFFFFIHTSFEFNVLPETEKETKREIFAGYVREEEIKWRG